MSNSLHSEADAGLLLKSKLKSFAVDFLAGGISGIAAKTACAPLDRVKLLMQTQKMNKSLVVPYTSSWNCGLRIYHEEGLLSLWRGNFANVYRYFPSQAFNFAFKDQFKGIFVPSQLRDDDKYGKLKIAAGSLLSGGLAGAASMILCYPFELARTRLATDSGLDRNTVGAGNSRRYVGTWDCLKKAYQSQGLTGLYGGLGISITGAIIFRALFMGGYDFMKFHYNLELNESKGGNGGNVDNRLTSRLLAAQVVTTVVGTLCYPIDTVKRRMMVQGEIFLRSAQLSSKAATIVPYRSSWHCFTSIVRNEGVKALFSGNSANLARGFSGPILLVGYDELKKVFSINM